MNRQNVTLSLPESLLKEAKLLAVTILREVIDQSFSDSGFS